MDAAEADWIDAFVRHLEGLMSVYDLGSEASAPDKSRAWNALSCVEQDIEGAFNAYYG